MPYSKVHPCLLESHLEELRKSAISDDIISKRGYRSVFGAKELEGLGFSKAQRRVPGFLLPRFTTDGTWNGAVYKPDHPQSNGKNKPVKYETPSGSQIRIDTHPGCIADLANPDIPLFITEGTKKLDSLVSVGACAIGLNGVWGFRGTNEFGGKTFLLDFDLIALNGRLVYLTFDSDSQTNLQVRKALERLTEHLKRKEARVRIVRLPAGPNGEKTGVDDYLFQGHNLDDLVGLAVDEAPTPEEKEPIAIHSPVYAIHQGQFCVIKSLKDVGKVYSPLCNFTAKISDEIVHDNGLEETRQFVIDGELPSGKKLRTIDVSAADFPNLGWISKEWGAKTTVYAGSAIKDHLRCVIQLSANGKEPRKVFTHTGWRQEDGKRFFLSAAGALGKNDVEVALRGPLGRYQLPMDYQDVDPIEAVRASISFMDLGKQDVMYPLWASMYLSPLCEILNPAFTLWLYGHTGSFKSVLSALALCHFGEFTYLTLPASWRDTANRLEWAMAMLKDLPLVIDDWHPAPSIAAQRELESKAEIVVRGQGNRAGRGRLRADASPRDSYIPRGLVISTGEQLPGGESHASRLFVLEPEPGDIDAGA
ncbi:MAG: DUF3854 domain-containing protein, partial [Chloroflexota bacterium]|nr:DUF3854 domain-containing protein [Chloroflexota bacterium]